MSFSSCADSDEQLTRTVVIFDTGELTSVKRLHVELTNHQDEQQSRDYSNAELTKPLVIHPAQDGVGQYFELLAEARDADGNILGSAALETGFVADEIRYVRLILKACAHATAVRLDASDLAAAAQATERASSKARVGADCSDPSPSVVGGHGGAPGKAGTGGYGGAVPSAGARAAGRGGNAADGGRVAAAGAGGKGGTAADGGAGGQPAGTGGAAGRPVTPAGGMGGAAGDGTAGAPSPEDVCGDGKRSGKEVCDTAIATGQADSCPTSCPTSDPCRPMKLTGEGCMAGCEGLTAITQAADNDECCPEGANANTDNDCEPMCGNGVVERTETCEKNQCTVEKLCTYTAPKCQMLEVTQEGRDTCKAECRLSTITACSSSLDGCCPKGCTYDQDHDCPPVTSQCGNGQVEEGETCEPSSDPNSADACPTSCTDSDPCTRDVLTGSADSCTAACSHTLITVFGPDGCCPKGANATTDGDCPIVCGNNVREGNELCDGTSCPMSAADCDDRDACTTDTVAGTDCQRKCTHARIAGVCANLLTGKVFTSSVGENSNTPGYKIDYATDGDDTTRWISEAESPVTLTVDLGATYTLTKIDIIWAGDTIYHYTLKLANDANGEWTVIVNGETTDTFKEETVHPTSTAPFLATATGRYFQIVGVDRHPTHTGFGNSIYEVKLYGTIVQ